MLVRTGVLSGRIDCRGPAFSRRVGGCGLDFLILLLHWERVVGDPSPHEAHGQGLLIDQILHAESR